MDAATMEGGPAQRWVALNRLIEHLETTTKLIKADREVASKLTIDDWVDQNIDRMTVLGMALRIDRKPHVTINGPDAKVDEMGAYEARQRVIRALRDNDLGDFVKENPSIHMGTIQAMVREQEDDLGNFDIPDDLAAALTITPVTRIAGVRA